MSILYQFISKKKQISPHISKIEFDLGILIISIWLVEKEGQYFLVDTALSSMAVYAVKRYLPQGVKAVFFTHGHPDHIGGLSKLLKEFSDTDLIINAEEFPYISGEKAYPDKKKKEKRTFNPADFLGLEEPKAKDLLAEAGLLPIFTPGHTPGHTSYYHAEVRSSLQVTSLHPAERAY